MLNFWPDITLEAGYQWQQLKQRLDPGQSVAAATYDHPLTQVQTDNIALTAVKQSLLQTYAPVFPDYGIVIPKIAANARIVPDVDPFDMSVYSKALSLGIAQASGTADPGKNGNTFLFAHSGRHFYDGIDQNVQFYLLDKLIPGDEVLIFKQGTIFIYKITANFRVWPQDVSYMTNQDFDFNQLTLMSCWPAGVNFQRQIVQARLMATL